jgi:hypothetical protein
MLLQENGDESKKDKGIPKHDLPDHFYSAA